MRKIFEKVVLRFGMKLCTFAVAVAAITPLCCRSQWYQPKEPENLEEFLNSKKNEAQ